MKSISREGLDPSEIITKQNVLIISERIALRALRTVLSISFNGCLSSKGTIISQPFPAKLLIKSPQFLGQVLQLVDSLKTLFAVDQSQKDLEI